MYVLRGGGGGFRAACGLHIGCTASFERWGVPLRSIWDVGFLILVGVVRVKVGFPKFLELTFFLHGFLLVAFTVNPRKLEHGFRMISAQIPSAFPQGL